MPYYVKGTDTLIQGTYEKVTICFPITLDLEPGGTWTYSGDPYTIWEEESNQERDDITDERLFLDEVGDEIPESMIEWRDE